MDDLDQVAAGPARVTQAEMQLRLLLDELLAARRALSRPLLERLDVFLHSQGAQALGVLDELAEVDLPVLLAAMPRTQCRLAVA